MHEAFSTLGNIQESPTVYESAADWWVTVKFSFFPHRVQHTNLILFQCDCLINSVRRSRQLCLHQPFRIYCIYNCQKTGGSVSFVCGSRRHGQGITFVSYFYRVSWNFSDKNGQLWSQNASFCTYHPWQPFGVLRTSGLWNAGHNFQLLVQVRKAN